MRWLYFDVFSGIAGDMTLSALLDLGVPPDVVRGAVEAVIPGEIELQFSRKKDHAIDAAYTVVVARDPAEGGGRLGESRHHVHRSHGEVRSMVEKASLSAAVKDKVLSIFSVLAKAEARVHGTTPEEVHFHEVGAWDSIADIVGVAAAVDYLCVDAIAASAVPVGSGFVETRHGRMPLPAPATLEILQGVPTVGTGVAAELTTPTGAAILKALVKQFGPMPPMTSVATGWGAGTRTLPDRPNLLRVVLGEAQETGLEWLLESVVDDELGQDLAHQLQRFLEEGALDAWLTPVVMKKGRPGVAVSVLCDDRHKARLTELLFRETATLGVRFTGLSREKLEREFVTLEASCGAFVAKVGRRLGEIVNVAPEFSSLEKLSVDTGIPLKRVRQLAQGAIADWLEQRGEATLSQVGCRPDGV